MARQLCSPAPWLHVLVAAIVFAALVLVSSWSYLLFHCVVEIFVIVVAAGIFVVAWNTRGITENAYWLHLGLALLFVAGLGMLHLLGYKGMGVFPRGGADLSTQLWIAMRYLLSGAFLLAPFAMGRPVRLGAVVAALIAVCGLVVLSIFWWESFPSCFVEGKGLTPFKVVSEVVICLILVAAFAVTLRRGRAFEPSVLRGILAAIACTVAAELCFSVYVSVYGLANEVGHLLTLLAFWFIYKAAIEAALQRPYQVLFRDLRQREEALRAHQENLEALVAQRTGELERQRALAIRSNRLRSLGEIAAGIAHELNQPLVGVRGQAEHLLLAAERGWDLSVDKVREKIGLVLEQADRMTHIIEHVRRFARESGEAHLVPIQANDAVEAAVGLVAAQFRSHGVALEVALAEDLPLVLGNRYSLEEVVINLLTNGRDAVEERVSSGAAGEAPCVSIRTVAIEEDGRTFCRIEVADTGAGLPAEIADKVFDPFFTTKPAERGTGLGLPISLGIVEEMGGRLTLTSVEGAGAVARVLLPAVR